MTDTGGVNRFLKNQPVMIFSTFSLSVSKQNHNDFIWFRIITATLLMLLLLTAGYPGFAQKPQSPVNISGTALKFPWSGGLNSCQFCAIDLNLDGIPDLLIFDRHGNRKLTFINHGTPNTIDYTEAPEYAAKFPDLHDWVQTVDYNCDGKMDIFTYGLGGVRVFENVSDTVLKFRLVTDLLESYYYSGKVGILVTSVDYPVLADLDGDGDLDLLTFFGLGSFVEYHKNLSMEKYGTCDSLDFKMIDHCWGKFKESESGNHIQLNVPCPYLDSLVIPGDFRNPLPANPSRNSRHTGSTMLATDLNGDGLQDLVVGDVDFPGLIALTNGGTRDSALMVAQDTLFPSPADPVHLFSFPAVSMIDIDNDGLKDLVISPFDPNLVTADNFNCVWFYKNTGSVSHPKFEFRTKRLFVDEMLDFGSASHPVLFDFDGDGLPDLFVGNDGIYDSSFYFQAVLHSVYTSKIAYYRNTGTATAPAFTLVTDDLAGISSLHLRGAYPTFGDLNGDGIPDLLTGNADGTLILFPTVTRSGVPFFGSPVLHYKGIDVGDYSAPQLFDLDKDNKPDLIIGEQNGNLNYYANTGTAANPLFTLVTDSLGKINVTNYNLSYNGFSTPCFFRLPDGHTLLLSGSDEGIIHFYTGIDNNLTGRFADTTGLFEWLSSKPWDSVFGWQTSPAIGHLTDAGSWDLITGNYSGGLNYISKRSLAGLAVYPDLPVSKLVVTPNPADNLVTITFDKAAPASPAAVPASESRILIRTLVGQLILDLPFPGKITLSTTSLPEGIYLLRCGCSTGKMVVTHP